MSAGELACVYASLILHDDEQEITADKINDVVKAAGVNVEAYWPALFAKLFETKKIEDLITNVGQGGGGGGGGGGGDAGAAAAPEPEPEEEEEEEAEFDLFD